MVRVSDILEYLGTLMKRINLRAFATLVIFPPRMGKRAWESTERIATLFANATPKDHLNATTVGPVSVPDPKIKSSMRSWQDV